MKYSIFLVLLTGILFGSTFAQQLTLETSTTQVDINQAFGLTVTVQDLENPGSVEIVGMQVFSVHGQSTANNVTIVNGVTHLQITLHLQLQPTSTGSFVIGPARVQVGSGIIESNTVTLEVIGEKLFVNPQSVVDLSGIILGTPASEAEAASFSRVPFLVGIILLGMIALILFKGNKWFTQLEQKNKQDTENVRIQKRSAPLPKLPRSNAAMFRDKLDLWMRHRLFQQGVKQNEGLTVQELRSAATSVLSGGQFHLLNLLLSSIQQAKYAGSEPDRHEVLQYAKKLLVIRRGEA